VIQCRRRQACRLYQGSTRKPRTRNHSVDCGAEEERGMADQDAVHKSEGDVAGEEGGRWPPQPMAVWPYTISDMRWARGERPAGAQAPQPTPPPAPSLSAPAGVPAAPPRRTGLHRRAAQQPITGEQIRQRRLALGWTQAQLAEKVGLSRPFIALVEQGRRILSPDDLARVREVLGI